MNKFYREGEQAYNDNKVLTKDNPYPIYSRPWQQWVNGFCDAGDKHMCELLSDIYGPPKEES